MRAREFIGGARETERQLKRRPIDDLQLLIFYFLFDTAELVSFFDVIKNTTEATSADFIQHRLQTLLYHAAFLR